MQIIAAENNAFALVAGNGAELGLLQYENNLFRRGNIIAGKKL